MTLCQVRTILSLIFRTQRHITREDAEAQEGQSHTKPGKASPALCASKLKPIDPSDEVAVILLRRRRISGDTVAFLQMLVFPGTKGP